MTDSLDFAVKWSRPRKGRTIHINCYELDTEELNVLNLERDEKWFEYIHSNRHFMPNLFPEADVIIGPISNDTIFDTMGILTSGHLSKAEVLPLMKIGPDYSQTVLKTDKASERLKWMKTFTLSDDEASKYDANRRKEGTEYHLRLSETMDNL